MKHAARLYTFLEVYVWRVKRTWNKAVLHLLSALSEIDEQDISALKKPSSVLGEQSPPASGKIFLRQSDTHVRWDCDIHHFWVRQVQTVHQPHVLFDAFYLKTWIAGPFFTDRADGIAFVVMCRKDKSLVRKFQQPPKNRLVLCTGIAILEIGSARTAYQQRIPGEYTIRHGEAVRVVRVTGCI